MLDIFVSEFGAEVTAKLQARAGHDEAQLRDPFARLLRQAGATLGVHVLTVDETPLDVLGVRPDFMVSVAGARVGYAELKAPGKKVPTTRSPVSRDKRQWDKLRLLPNVLYTDGEQWAVYRYGELHGVVAQLDGALRTSGSKLAPADGSFERVMQDFLLWKPDPPRTIGQLVRAVASLCRLLRDEVSETLRRERSGEEPEPVFSGLVEDWRSYLFPGLSDGQFADAYAQTVTFALLLARVDGISFEGTGFAEIARQLGKKHSLLGKALDVLTERIAEQRSIVLTSLQRVIGAVDWDVVSEKARDSYLSLYERFLEEYDPKLRRRSGSYYTPNEVVAFMVRFVDEILRHNMKIDWGLAADDVTIIDPAMGTGTFLLNIIDSVARTVCGEQGEGAVGPQLRALFSRLIGFEKQAGPYAVAQLRIHQALKGEYQTEIPEKEVKLLVADTLDDPHDDLYTEQVHIPSTLEPIARSRREANKIKLKVPIFVVIGNPPFAERARGLGGWIEAGSPNSGPAPIQAFRAPGRGKFENVLSSLYVYFWRWATWKVFDAHDKHRDGIVAFISPASFTTGSGYAGMREYLRRTADEGWIIDLSPGKFRPAMSTRIFRGVQHKLCIAVFARYAEGDHEAPARVHYIAATGNRDEKIRFLNALSFKDDGWSKCSDGPQDPLIPAARTEWRQYPALGDVMPWSQAGVTPNRNWVNAPDKSVLQLRWSRLIKAGQDEQSVLLKETDARTIRSRLPGLPGERPAAAPLVDEKSASVRIVPFALRSFDRQYVIYDARVLDRPRPALWHVRGNDQVYVTEQHAHAIEPGPGLTFTSLVPSVHHFNGRGGRVLPLYRDKEGQQPNIAPGLLNELERHLETRVTAPDVLAYIAAVTAHPAYTRRFAAELKTPGIRIPLTRSIDTWNEAVNVGRTILWLHTYGERYTDPAQGRTKRPPLLPMQRRPKVVTAIPSSPDEMPDKIDHDDSTDTLRIGNGLIRPVARSVWEYEVSGMRVIRKWFDYRKRNPRAKWSSPLDDIVATTWSATYTTELLELLNILAWCVDLEPRQAALLDRICAGPMIASNDLQAAGVFPVPTWLTKPPAIQHGDDPLTLLSA